MYKIKDFCSEHIQEAKRICLFNYNEERENVLSLPEIADIPDLNEFVDNKLGVSLFDDDKLVGFICTYDPWDNAFNSKCLGTYSPIHAHGAVKENRKMIYQLLYQAFAEKLVNKKILYHAIGLYAHDKEALECFFINGFGTRCMDAIRPIEVIDINMIEDITYKEITKKEEQMIRSMRKKLNDHLGKSPCFLYTSEENFNEWIKRAETRNSRTFIAMKNDLPIAYLEITNNGENFATYKKEVINICGAYCEESNRGKNIFQGLLNYTIKKLKEEGFTSLGVDFESFNPTAYYFWSKYFTIYTNSLTRRIDL